MPKPDILDEPSRELDRTNEGGDVNKERPKYNKSNDFFDSLTSSTFDKP